jgi:hypothetical protein
MVGDTMSNASEIEFPGIDTSKDILPQVSKSSVLQAMLETQLGLQDYTQAMKESLAKQSELTQAEKTRLQKQTSPIDYISDLLIGFAAADPEAGMGAQAAAAAEYASAQKEAVQDEIAKLERDLAAGNLTQAEAALKLRQLQATTLSDIYEATSPAELKSSDVNSLRRIAADRLGATYDPETDTLTGTPEQKKAVASLLRRMLQAYSKDGYDAAMAVAIEGQEIDENEKLAADDDVADATTKNIEQKIQELK